MNCNTINVHWHDDNHPVYSLDFQPNCEGKRSTRLATGGGDNNVRIWRLIYDAKDVSVETVEYLSTLAKHTQAVNVVKFDPKGEMLATAGDDGTIFIWGLSQAVVKEFGQEDDEAKESWVVKYTFRSSGSEIYDLAWSPDSQYVITGSMDNLTRLYSLATNQQVSQIAEHNHYVQGVCWDPRSEYIATQSADRSVHIYSLNKHNDNTVTLNPTLFYKSLKGEIPSARLSSATPTSTPKKVTPSPSPKIAPTSLSSMNPPTTHKRTKSASSSGSIPRPSSPLPAVRTMEPPLNLKNSLLYHSETLQSFFRRLTFSPDGTLLFTPSGIFKSQSMSRDGHITANTTAGDDITNTVYIYTRAGLNHNPIAHLPGMKKPAIAIAFSPIIYTNRAETLSSIKYINLKDGVSEKKEQPIQNRQEPVFALDYRMMYAVATQDSVIIYDTQQLTPIAFVSSLHYSTFTDLSWSNDGTTLMVSSTDGFCSAIVFDKELLGEVLTHDVRTIMNNCPTRGTPAMLTPTSSMSEASLSTKDEEREKSKPPSVLEILEQSQLARKEMKKEIIEVKSEEDDPKKKKRRIAPILVTQQEQ